FPAAELMRDATHRVVAGRADPDRVIPRVVVTPVVLVAELRKRLRVEALRGLPALELCGVLCGCATRHGRQRAGIDRHNLGHVQQLSNRRAFSRCPPRCSNRFREVTDSAAQSLGITRQPGATASRLGLPWLPGSPAQYSVSRLCGQMLNFSV